MRRRPRRGSPPPCDQTSLFLALVGLSALLVGGIGVATGVRAWLEGRARTIATLRCLGASARLIFGVFLIQVLALCARGHRDRGGGGGGPAGWGLRCSGTACRCRRSWACTRGRCCWRRCTAC